MESLYWIRSILRKTLDWLCLALLAFFNFFPIHRTYFCVRSTDGPARIYFFLSLTLLERVTLWLRIIPVHVRERGKKKEEEEEKSPEKTTLPWPGFELQSRACYPLGHGALPLLPKTYELKRSSQIDCY